MDEKNELNDIILNRSSGNSGMKKLMLAVASLAILLIIVVVIMSSLNSGGTANLPQPIEPPQTNQVPSPVEDDPLFEPMAIDEAASEEESLDNVAKKIKEQSENSELIAGPDEMIEEETEVVVPAKYEKPVKEEPKQVTKPVESKPVAKKESVKSAVKGNYYIQVGSFGRFAPDKKFLQKITNSGYSYIIHDAKVNGVSMTKVLVGPYSTDKAARKDLPSVRSKIEPGAFLSRI
jgi:DedD protein